ncbi:superinfection exclusion protein [Escherichia phage TrudiGerster]|uniref:Superinfection exclusion protein n=1 Tax=Escherichia phage TrudiGerster TaxID=2851991 RepID=A0AAE7VZW1_9CAUD|nr:superinfection exclusion protein [Escherichia phage TrudiGerster]
MKKLLIALATITLLSGCAPQPKPFCTSYVKTSWAAGSGHYSLTIRDVREVGYRFPKVQMRTKFGWWDLSQFDLKYGDCKFNLEQSGYL